MSLFATPLSGLNASSTALQAISNNLANMNTDGYKSQTAVFADVFYQNMGSSGNNNPIQTGFGVQVAGMSRNMTNGPISATGIASNVALDGAGYFVTRSASGAISYTRAGDFVQNNAGELTALSGDLVMGYPAEGGNIITSGGLGPINVGQGVTVAGTATKNLAVATNLDASAAVGETYTPSPFNVYDSLGEPHLVTLSYTKTGAGEWSYSVTIPAADVASSSATPSSSSPSSDPASPPSSTSSGAGSTSSPVQLASGTLTFDDSGKLASSSDPVALKETGALSDGASALNLNWTLADASGKPLITQAAIASSSNSPVQDGYSAGTLSNYSVLADGTVQATFSNGESRAVGRIAIATFANPEGLQLNGSNQYQVTASSGQGVIGIAGVDGCGTIKGSNVEQSNVDVATQLANLIVAQRSYEANAKAITTFDQIEQDTISMKSA